MFWQKSRKEPPDAVPASEARKMRDLLTTIFDKIPATAWKKERERKSTGTTSRHRVTFTTTTMTGARIRLIREVVGEERPEAPVTFQRRYLVYFDHNLLGSEEYGAADEQAPEQSIGAYCEALCRQLR